MTFCGVKSRAFSAELGVSESLNKKDNRLILTILYEACGWKF